MINKVKKEIDTITKQYNMKQQEEAKLENERGSSKKSSLRLKISKLSWERLKKIFAERRKRKDN
jgi:hypothetical protein